MVARPLLVKGGVVYYCLPLKPTRILYGGKMGRYSIVGFSIVGFGELLQFFWYTAAMQMQSDVQQSTPV
ncbi:hypothetical protein AKJ16_DCAP09358 [Drosera capensis]